MTELVDYGILNEKSDIRSHVAPVTRSIFVFQTMEAVRCVASGKYRAVPAFQPGVDGCTAMGYLVPPNDIPGIRIVRWQSVKWWENFHKTDDTTLKGKAAVDVVCNLMKIGRFPFWVDPYEENDDLKVQISGVDVLVVGKWKIQVKCDYTAGLKSEGGSGNLFLQIAERNPLRKF